MQPLVRRVRKLVGSGDDRGAVFTEYGLLLVLIAMAAVGALVVLGAEVVELFTESTETWADTLDNSPTSDD